MLIVPANRTLVIPVNRNSTVFNEVPSWQLWLNEDAEARTTNENIDTNNTITPLGPSGSAAWITAHDTAGGPFRELTKTYPTTTLGSSGTFKGVSFDDTTAHHHSLTVALPVGVRKSESRWWLNTNATRQLGVILSGTSSNIKNTGSNQVYAEIYYSTGTAYIRVMERTGSSVFTRATTVIGGFPSSSERYVDMETEISADWTTVTATARSYDSGGTLLDTQSAVWNKGSSIYVGDYKGVFMYGADETIVMDFCKFYIWGY